MNLSYLFNLFRFFNLNFKFFVLTVFKKLKLESKLILTVHDSIVVDVHPLEIELVKNCITVAMKHINTDMKRRWNYEPSIALDIEMAIGKNWMEMSEM